MENYTKPELTIKELKVMDIIQTSGLIDGGEGGGTGTIIIPDPEPQTLSLWEK